MALICKPSCERPWKIKVQLMRIWQEGKKKKAGNSIEIVLLQSSEGDAVTAEEVKKNNHVQRKLEVRQEGRVLDLHLEEQFSSGKLLICFASRPGQYGRANGYILEGKEIEFYMKKLQKKNGKDAGAA